MLIQQKYAVAAKFDQFARITRFSKTCCVSKTAWRWLDKRCCISKYLPSQQKLADSAEIHCVSKHVAESANYLVMSQQKMLSKQKLAKIPWSSAVLAKFDESSLTQQLTSTTDYDCTLSPSFLFLVTPLATQCWLWLVFYSFCIANLMALWYVIYFRF